MTNPNNDRQIAAYVSRLTEAGEILARLTEYVANHGDVDPDAVNWGHVGDAGHLLQTLQQAAAFVFNEGEYAN